MTGPAGAPVPQPPGFFEREIGKILPRAEADAAEAAADVATALRDHAGTVFDVAGDVIAVAGYVDPADATLLAALDALVPKVLAMAESAASVAGAAMRRGTPAAG